MKNLLLNQMHNVLAGIAVLGVVAFAELVILA